MHDGSVFASPESDIPKTNSWRKGSFMLIKIKELNSWKILFGTFLLSIQDTNNPTWGGGGWGGECHLFLAGNRVLLLGNRRFSWREIACPPLLLKNRFFKSLVCLAKRFSSTELLKFKTREKYPISITGRKKFKRILSSLFGGGRKVQVTKFVFDSRTSFCFLHDGELVLL